MQRNLLYCGDNLSVLRKHVADSSVDLGYLDPPLSPYSPNGSIFSDVNAFHTAQQAESPDGWPWNEETSILFEDALGLSEDVASVLLAFRRLLGDSGTLGFLTVLAPRLLELKRVLKPTGSLFVHCNAPSSQYVKLLVDAVLGPQLLQNEIIWHYRRWSTGKQSMYRWPIRFPRNHDTILFYARSGSRDRSFRQPYARHSVRDSLATAATENEPQQQRPPDSASARDWLRLDDVWDIGLVPPSRRYIPAQRPEVLLERIVEASTEEGQTVLDPYCGGGTALLAAERLGRAWIGIDQTYHALAVTRYRLGQAFGSLGGHIVVGGPTSLNEAEGIASSCPAEFIWWALEMMGALPVEQRSGADRGFDGRVSGAEKGGLVSVKPTAGSVKDVRDLQAALEKEKAAFGVLVTLKEPPPLVRAEASRYGARRPAEESAEHPQLRVLTVSELLAGESSDALADSR